MVVSGIEEELKDTASRRSSKTGTERASVNIPQFYYLCLKQKVKYRIIYMKFILDYFVLLLFPK
jgi:hypothetical protein